VRLNFHGPPPCLYCGRSKWPHDSNRRSEAKDYVDDGCHWGSTERLIMLAQLCKFRKFCEFAQPPSQGFVRHRRGKRDSGRFADVCAGGQALAAPATAWCSLLALTGNSAGRIRSP
jgi:hypothetical protein